MMPSLPIRHRTDTRNCARLSPGSAPACIAPQDWPVIASQILLSGLRSARSRQHPRPRFEPKHSNRPPQPNVPNIPAAAKSP
jgi:hypothetical protein